MSQAQTKFILVAMSEVARAGFRSAWEDAGINVVEALSYDHALELARTPEVQGIVAMQDWFWTKEERIRELFRLAQNRIPTVALINDFEDGGWISEIFTSQFHVYRHYPLGKRELIDFMKQMLTFDDTTLNW